MPSLRLQPLSAAKLGFVPPPRVWVTAMTPAHSSPALRILLMQSKTNEVIHSQLQIRGRQEAWKKSHRGILPLAKVKDAGVLDRILPPHPGQQQCSSTPNARDTGCPNRQEGDQMSLELMAWVELAAATPVHLQAAHKDVPAATMSPRRE